jgi:hypothetical protein
MARAVRDVYARIVVYFHGHTVDGSQWIYFNNTGEWDNGHFLDRDAVAEFQQFSSLPSASKYYTAFTDRASAQLNASRGRSYTLTMTPTELPDCSQFWSLTMYKPRGVTMVPNSLKRYAVGSYSPFKTNSDGSVTIFFAHRQPSGAPQANWLPAPNGPFEIMMRCYGPEGNTAGDTYAPPAITP